jgi:hypothetical protein
METPKDEPVQTPATDNVTNTDEIPF